MSIRSLTALAIFTLAACNGGGLTMVNYIDTNPYYNPSTVSWTVVDGRFPAEVYGQPFADRTETAETIAAAISGPSYAPPSRLTADPAAAEKRAGHRVVLVFNPSAFPSFKRLCADASAIKTAGASASVMNVHAAYCARDEVVSTGVLRAAPGKDPSDPVFHKSMQHLIENLLPPTSPNDDGAVRTGV